MHRTWAIIERELRRFRRSPTLIIMSLVMPIVQLVVLGYAFGGQVKHLKVGLVDQDHGVPAVRLHELSNAVAANAKTFEPVMYNDLGAALGDLRNGRINGVLAIPPDFSRRSLAGDAPRVALIEDNTDNFVSASLAGAYAGAHRLVQPAGGRATARGAAHDARRRRDVSVRALHPVPAAGLHRHVDLHDGDDRRRHHLRRRQGAGAARGLSRHADHALRAHSRVQSLGRDQGRARGARADDDRLAHRRRAQSVRSTASRAAVRRDRGDRVRARQHGCSC